MYSYTVERCNQGVNRMVLYDIVGCYNERMNRILKMMTMSILVPVNN